jgi:hypothetical protein
MEFFGPTAAQELILARLWDSQLGAADQTAPPYINHLNALAQPPPSVRKRLCREP